MQDEHGLRLYQGTSERWPPDVFSSLLGSTTQHQHLGLQDLFVRSQTPKHSLTISSFGNPVSVLQRVCYYQMISLVEAKVGRLTR